MNKLINIFQLITAGLLMAQSGHVHVYEPVTVTASRLQTALVSDLRESEVFTQQEIAAMPAGNVTELLTFLGQAEFKQRSPGGVQADFSVRGSSFEQVIILVDGIRMNDPQTGHHNGDLPVALDEIERIEVLPGHASSIYGPDAFGGVIHIITKSLARQKASVKLSRGAFNSWGGALTMPVKTGSWYHRLALERSSSDGHRYDTDYEINTVGLSSKGSVGGKGVEFRIAYMGKNFGANGFYAPLPSYEETRALTGQAGIVWKETGPDKVSTKLFLRKHEDHFVLTVDNPAYYQNDQDTWTMSIENQWRHDFSESLQGVLGCEVYGDRLISPGLGNHNRSRWAVFSEGAWHVDNFTALHLGLRADGLSNEEMQISPTLSIKRSLGNFWLIRASAGRSFRAPTYTELFYNSPANQGDIDLKPESAWSAELGFKFQKGHHTVESTFFHRDENNRIDWIQARRAVTPDSSVNYWQAMNLGQVNLNGYSLQVLTRFTDFWTARINYTALSGELIRESNIVSKYAWAIPKHRVMLQQTVKAGKSLEFAAIIRYIQRENQDEIWLGDISSKYYWRSWNLVINLRNIFDTSYEEIIGAPMPGRHAMISLQHRF